MKSSTPSTAVQYRDPADLDQAPLDAAGLVAAVSEIAATVAVRTLAQQPPAVVRVPYPVPAPAPAPIEVRIPAAAAEPVAPQDGGRRLFTRAELVFYTGLTSAGTAATTTVATLLFASTWTLVSPLVGLLTTLGASIVMHHQDHRPGQHVIPARTGVDRHGRPVSELDGSPSLRVIEGGRS